MGFKVNEVTNVLQSHQISHNRDRLSSPVTGKVRAVTFDATLWKPAMINGASMYKVRKTQYSPTELVRIGKQLSRRLY